MRSCAFSFDTFCLWGHGDVNSTQQKVRYGRPKVPLRGQSHGAATPFRP